MTTIDLTLPRPTTLQREIIDHPATRKVVCAGRRAGKTTLASVASVEAFLKGQRVLLSSTSQDQADVFWRYITSWLSSLLDVPGYYKNETKRLIRLGSGEIRVKTGKNHDALRGDGVSLLVLDECAYLNPLAWQEVGSPMLADSDGTAIFISTPKRRNWFFHLYTQAVSDDSDRWQAWHFTSHSNPHLSRSALDALAQDMTQDSYKQEIEAEFLEGQGAVFRYIDDVATLERKAPYTGEFIMGVDWAQTTDYTVIMIMDRNTRQVVDYDRFNGIDWSLQRGRLKALHDRWKPSRIIAESNSIGSPNIEALQKEGLPVVAFQTTGTSKPPLIESLVLAFDRREIAILNDPIIVNELMAYERKITSTGRSQYSAPDGLHDDTVMALALAWHGITQSSRLILWD